MSEFSTWFTTEYQEWVRSQPGEEDFLAFCDLLGYPPAKILGWLHGKSLPEGPEVLSIAGIFGMDIYAVVNLPQPDPELLKIFKLFSHLQGNDRSKLALTIFEVEKLLQENNISNSSPEGKKILKNMIDKYGLNE